MENFGLVIDLENIGCTATTLDEETGDEVKTDLSDVDAILTHSESHSRRLLGEVAREEDTEEEERSGIVCEYAQLDLTCDVGYEISVIGATWGRDDNYHCGLGRNHCPMSDASSF